MPSKSPWLILVKILYAPAAAIGFPPKVEPCVPLVSTPSVFSHVVMPIGSLPDSVCRCYNIRVIPYHIAIGSDPAIACLPRQLLLPYRFHELFSLCL